MIDWLTENQLLWQSSNVFTISNETLLCLIQTQCKQTSFSEMRRCAEAGATAVCPVCSVFFITGKLQWHAQTGRLQYANKNLIHTINCFSTQHKHYSNLPHSEAQRMSVLKRFLYLRISGESPSGEGFTWTLIWDECSGDPLWLTRLLPRLAPKPNDTNAELLVKPWDDRPCQPFKQCLKELVN